MKKIGIISYTVTLAVLLLIFSIIIFIMSGFNTAFLAFAVIAFAALSISGYSVYKRRFSVGVNFLEKISKSLNPSNKYSMEKFPLPIVVSASDGSLIWYNECFFKNVMLGVEPSDSTVSQFLEGKKVSELKSGEYTDIECRGKSYRVIKEPTSLNKKDIFIFYFIDNSDFVAASENYERSSPVVMIISVDGIDEASTLKDSEKAGYIGAVENILEEWVSENKGFMRKTDTMKFICVMQEGQYKDIVDKKFDILDRVRSYSYNGVTGATLSIGVGREKTLPECDESARQAFDMALGRGGDQAAAKKEDEFEFFGGVSKGVEKRTKVRIRVVASNLKKYIAESGNVLVMGHKFSDLDSMGASIAMCSAARAMGKRANIVVSKATTLALPLIDMLEKNGIGDMTIEPDEALGMANDRTLLIVVDTHIKDLLESRDVYNRCKTVVVIDHHRKVVGHIDNAAIFHHEPFSSSASEMVTELLQYMGSKQLIGTLQAEALLSGIMLDTKNFALRTGVRTFEAAAYLRSNGADTIAVRRFFSNSMKTYEERNRVVSNTQIFGDYAMSTVDFDSDNIRVVSAQAADEMLNINGVRASFVLYRTETSINISARSFGDVNVQLIMEKIGGGGHQTMAAAQLKCELMDDAKSLLINAIKEYIADLS